MFRSHSTVTCVFAVWNVTQFLIVKCLRVFHYILCVNGKLYISYFRIIGRTVMRLQKPRFLSLSVSFPLVWSCRPLAMPLFRTASASDVVQVISLLPVSESEAGRECCFDRTCKSILFTGKQRLIPQ